MKHNSAKGYNPNTRRVYKSKLEPENKACKTLDPETHATPRTLSKYIILLVLSNSFVSLTPCLRVHVIQGCCCMLNSNHRSPSAAKDNSTGGKIDFENSKFSSTPMLIWLITSFLCTIFWFPYSVFISACNLLNLSTSFNNNNLTVRAKVTLLWFWVGAGFLTDTELAMNYKN